MAYEVPALPYSFDALEPHIDARTMEIHHDKHHAAYVTNLNKALEGHADLQKKSIEDLLRDIKKVPDDIRTAVQNNGGGHANHTLFWTIMSADGGGEPEGDLADAIADSFKSFSAFKERFTSRVVKDRPDKICVDYIEGPLKYLHNEWVFEPADDGGTNVHFSVDFAFRSRLFESLAGQMFDRALRRMTSAFERRAASLYGINNSSAQSAA